MRYEQGGPIQWIASKSPCARVAWNAPSVEITEEGIAIGEDENTVRLTHAEWNELVGLIKRGELREV